MNVQIDIVHIFDYRFLKNDSVDVDIFNRACNIERSKGNTANQPRDIGPVMSALENRAILMSVMDSNAIEGIRTTEDRLVALVSGRVSPIGHDECEIAGYRDALRFIHLNHENIILNKEFILELYNMLMSNTGDGPFGFKERDNVIIDRGADGTITDMYRTVSAAETEESIDQLLMSYWEVRDDVGIHKLLLIPCFIMDFLRIHPFPDGNGRMSRLLTTLLLYQEGYDICRYVSMESKINSSKAYYYKALEESQVGWFENDCDYRPFISYFLDQLFLCYRELNLNLGTEMGRRKGSDALESFLRMCTIHVSKRDLCSMFPDISESTVSRVLKRMCDSGELMRIGGSKSTRYVRVK